MILDRTAFSIKFWIRSRWFLAAGVRKPSTGCKRISVVHSFAKNHRIGNLPSKRQREVGATVPRRGSLGFSLPMNLIQSVGSTMAGAAAAVAVPRPLRGVQGTDCRIAQPWREFCVGAAARDFSPRSLEYKNCGRLGDGDGRHRPWTYRLGSSLFDRDTPLDGRVAQPRWLSGHAAKSTEPLCRDRVGGAQCPTGERQSMAWGTCV